jgi:hypothetical protein
MQYISNSGIKIAAKLSVFTVIHKSGNFLEINLFVLHRTVSPIFFFFAVASWSVESVKIVIFTVGLL